MHGRLAAVAADTTTTTGGRLSGATGAGTGGGRVRRARGNRPPVEFLVPVVVLLGAVAVYPLVELVRMALSNVGPTNVIGAHWPFVGVDNLRDQLTSSGFWDATLRTVEFMAVLLVLNLVLGFLAASALAARGRFTSFVLGLMVFVWSVPPLVSASVWKFVLNPDGAANSILHTFGLPDVDWLSDPSLAIWVVAAVAGWASIPFATLVIRGGLIGIPQDVLEAAAIDGAGYWRSQWRIVIPSIRPTLGILTILTILYAFRGFDFIYVLTNGGPGTSTITLPYLAYQNAFVDYSWSIAAAIALLTMAVVVLLAVPYVSGVRKEEAA